MTSMSRVVNTGSTSVRRASEGGPKLTFEQLEPELVQLINDKNEAGNLPALIFDISVKDLNVQRFCCKLWWGWILSFGIQATQVYLTYQLLLDSTDTERRIVARWIDEGYLQWLPESEQDSGFSGYDFEQECKRNSIYVVDILTTNIVVATQRGRDLIWTHVTVGALLLSFHVAGDIVSIFFENQYQIVAKKHIGYRRMSPVYNLCRVLVGILVLLGQITINIFVGVVCAGAIASSCLDISGIVIAGVEAYFILELDDILLGAFKKCLQLTGGHNFDNYECYSGEHTPLSCTLYDTKFFLTHVGHKFVTDNKVKALRERESKTTIFAMFSNACVNLRNMRRDNTELTPLHKTITYCNVICCFCIPVTLMFAICVVCVTPIFLCIAAIWHLGISGTVLEKISVVENHTDDVFIFPFFHQS